jgi:hypothetical protein
LFQAGIAFGFSGAALLSGLGMVFGADALEAAGRGIIWFAGMGVLGWLAELWLGPVLERMAQAPRQDFRPDTASPPVTGVSPGEPAKPRTGQDRPADEFKELGGVLRQPAASRPAHGA